jgi:hypothetical protein
MSTTNSPRKEPIIRRIVNSYEIYLVLGALLLFKGKALWGIASVFYGLIVRLESKIDGYRSEIKSTAAEQSIHTDALAEEKPFCLAEEEPFYLDMTVPILKADSGWDNVHLYPSRHQYERQRCYGGPPEYEEIWEYDIKAHASVFVRLLDRHKEDLNDEHQYDVVNGCIQEDVIERENRDHETWLNSLPEKNRETFQYQPYSAKEIAELKREVIWHELQGAVKYFILSKHDRMGEWKRDLEKLRNSFELIVTEAEALGATCNKFGSYELPNDADDLQRKKLEDIFSSRNLLGIYGVHSYRDWAERDQIMKLLESPQEDNRG